MVRARTVVLDNGPFENRLSPVIADKNLACSRQYGETCLPFTNTQRTSTMKHIVDSALALSISRFEDGGSEL
jgi:hypothetical protein